MSGRPKCPNPKCQYQDPGFGPINDRIKCGGCGEMYDPEEAYATEEASPTVPTAPQVTSPPPTPPGFRRVGVIDTKPRRKKKPRLTKDGNRPKSPGRRSDRGDNSDPKSDYSPYGGNDA